MAKIYEYIKIDIDSGDVLEEKSYEYEGPMMMCGGGGTSGSFDFPYVAMTGANKPTKNYTWAVEALSDMAQAYISADVGDRTGGGAGSPFQNESSNVPDPDTYMGSTDAADTQNRMNKVGAIVDALDEETDWDSITDNAIAKADEAATFPDISVTSDVSSVHSAERTSVTSAIDSALDAAAAVVADTPIAARVTAYEERIKKQYLRSMSRMAAGFADINAVNSSAFIFGIAFLERQLLEDVDRYDAELDIQSYKEGFDAYISTFKETFRLHLQSHMSMKGLREGNRDRMVLDGTRTMASMLGTNLQAGQVAAHLQSEINRIRWEAEMREQEAQVSFDEQDASWEFNVMTHVGNMLAAAGGAAMIPQTKMTKTQSVLSGAATGAAIGTEVAPGLGTGIGAVIGAIGGAIE